MIKIGQFRRPLVVGVFCVGVFAASQAQTADRTLAAQIASLGNSSTDEKVVSQIAKKPADSIPLLIRQLQTVSLTHERQDQNDFSTEHVLWTIRTLRYISGGKDFCATTKYAMGASRSYGPRFGEDRRYWLDPEKTGCLKFFALWPSHGSTFIAPPDVQVSIIKQWTDWAHSTDASTLKPMQHPKPEDWSW